MTTLDKEVAEWMAGLGFELKGKISDDSLWLKPGLPPVNQVEATFFYTATKGAELKAQIKVYKVWVEDGAPRYIETLLDELEAQLNNSNKENE